MRSACLLTPILIDVDFLLLVIKFLLLCLNRLPDDLCFSKYNANKRSTPISFYFLLKLIGLKDPPLSIFNKKSVFLLTETRLGCIFMFLQTIEF